LRLSDGVLPEFRVIANNQPNKDTHPVYIQVQFPDGAFTGGFGATPGDHAGTLRSCDDIAPAWDSIGDNEVPHMGGFGTQYPHATKSKYDAPSTQYPNGLLPTLLAQCAALPPAG